MTHQVALLGTGIMGGAMARMIASAGMPTRVWNRSRAKAEALAGDGIEVAADIAGAVLDATVVVTMLADDAAVRSVADTAIPAMGRDAVWVQMSTVGVTTTLDLAARAAADGIAFVDAPVLGSKRAAEAGQLTVLASGDGDAIARCQPVFDAIGTRTIRLGEAGDATKLKLVVNSWLLGMLGALAESITLARAMDLDPARFLDTIEGGATGNLYARVKGDLMIAGEYPVAFPLSLARKDARLMLAEAARAGRSLPALHAVEGVFGAAEDAGFGTHDMAALIEGLRG